MAETIKPYLRCIRDAVTFSMDLRNFPSQNYEKMNRPQVEVQENQELVMKPLTICRNEEEKVEIEASINSVRVNIVIKKHVELENLLVDIYTKFLMNRADKFNILRKKPKKDYDISFLITNFHLEFYKKEAIIDFIVEFIQDLEKEINDMKLIVNSQSRVATTYFMEQLKI
jgi:actin related protein 2/3 complex subunit 4